MAIVPSVASLLASSPGDDLGLEIRPRLLAERSARHDHRPEVRAHLLVLVAGRVEPHGDLVRLRPERDSERLEQLTRVCLVAPKRGRLKARRRGRKPRGQEPEHPGRLPRRGPRGVGDGPTGLADAHQLPGCLSMVGLEHVPERRGHDVEAVVVEREVGGLSDDPLDGDGRVAGPSAGIGEPLVRAVRADDVRAERGCGDGHVAAAAGADVEQPGPGPDRPDVVQQPRSDLDDPVGHRVPVARRPRRAVALTSALHLVAHVALRFVAVGLLSPCARTSLRRPPHHGRAAVRRSTATSSATSSSTR